MIDARLVALQGFGWPLNPLALAVQGLVDYIAGGGSTSNVEVSIDISDLRKKRSYVKHKKKIYVFDTTEQADQFLASIDRLEEVVKTKTSRRARKRAKERVITVKPAEVVDLPQVQQWVNHFDLPFDLPDLIAQQDWARVLEIYAQAMRMMDDEDEELLLLA